ncbi:hypothetical protein MRX96_028540 [Rhipicephalus microplus]
MPTLGKHGDSFNALEKGVRAAPAIILILIPLTLSAQNEKYPFFFERGRGKRMMTSRNFDSPSPGITTSGPKESEKKKTLATGGPRRRPSDNEKRLLISLRQRRRRTAAAGGSLSSPLFSPAGSSARPGRTKLFAKFPRCLLCLGVATPPARSLGHQLPSHYLAIPRPVVGDGLLVNQALPRCSLRFYRQSSTFRFPAYASAAMAAPARLGHGHPVDHGLLRKVTPV